MVYFLVNFYIRLEISILKMKASKMKQKTECPNCASDLSDEIRKGWKYCPYCGAYLRDIVEYPEEFSED